MHQIRPAGASPQTCFPVGLGSAGSGKPRGFLLRKGEVSDGKGKGGRGGAGDVQVLHHFSFYNFYNLTTVLLLCQTVIKESLKLGN